MDESTGVSLFDSNLGWLPSLPAPPLHGERTRQRPLITLKDLLSDRSLTVKRPKQQPPSLIFRLPPEMLAEICVHTTAEDQDKLSLEIPMRSHFVLSHVCALWRAVALYTPSLWSRVVFHLGDRKTGFGNIANLAKVCFERSCELPLTVIITSSVHDPSSIPNLCMTLLLPVRHRVRHLELALPAVFTESLFKLPKNSLKALQTVEIAALLNSEALLPENAGCWFRAMSALEGAPLLYSVKFSGIHPVLPLHSRRTAVTRPLRFDPHVAGLPWDQLTELSLGNLEIRCEDALHVLELATALSRFTINLRVFEPIAPVIAFTQAPAAPVPSAPLRPKPPITAPALVSLDAIVSGWVGAPAEFLDRLVLPSLTHLSIKHSFAQALPCSTLTNLQTRSEFSLQQLFLTSRTGDTLLPFLQANPTLWRLQLVFCSMALGPLVGALARIDAEPPLLPRLRALTLADRWSDEASAVVWGRATKAVVGMARARWRGQGDRIARLDSLVLGSQAGLGQKMGRLQKLQEAGMRVRLVHIFKERQNIVVPDYINTWADGYSWE
ncbi:hypothetical protein C8R43DRAFT_1164687 [Mycena crocata]|nr:hypothetical protein C8R43DRAFT_1164687 [Mycena crocata]